MESLRLLWTILTLFAARRNLIRVKVSAAAVEIHHLREVGLAAIQEERSGQLWFARAVHFVGILNRQVPPLQTNIPYLYILISISAKSADTIMQRRISHPSGR